jgi:hypothetical protein
MLDRFRAGEDAVHDIEAAELGNIAGKKVPEGCGGCPRIPYWSNPRIKYKGDPTGTAANDNARVILAQAERVSKFRGNIRVWSENRCAVTCPIQQPLEEVSPRAEPIIAADSPNAFVDDRPTAAFVRQVLGAVAQLQR